MSIRFNVVRSRGSGLCSFGKICESRFHIEQQNTRQRNWVLGESLRRRMTANWKRWLCIGTPLPTIIPVFRCLWQRCSPSVLSLFLGAIVLATLGATAQAVTPQIAAGGSTNCAIDNTGQLYCWGSDAWGQLGLGRSIGSSTPLRAGEGFMQPSQAGQT